MPGNTGDARARTRRTGRSQSTRTRLVAVVVAVLLGLWVGPTTTAAAGGPGRDHGADRVDLLSLSAYDFETELPADVVAGSVDNNLRLDLTAGRRLVDATVVVALPGRSWPTDLHTAGLLSARDPDLPGSFVVRPDGTDFLPGDGDCRGTGDEPITVSVSNAGGQHIGVVRHLSCDPGQRTSIRIVAIAAPQHAGRVRVPVVVSDASGLVVDRALSLPVRKPPTTRLVLSAPAQVPVGATRTVEIRALRPDGKVDTRAVGWVRLTGPGGDDCLFSPGAPLLVELTPGDAGVKDVDLTFRQTLSGPILVQSVSHRQLDTLSDPVAVVGDSGSAVCSVSYH